MDSPSKRPKRVRLVDIAERVGVSRRAVSTVLLGTGGTRVSVSTDKARRIREVARELGYRPNKAAQQLVGKRSRTYGLLVASAGDPLRSFLIQYLDAEAVRRGNHVLIGNTVVGPNRFEVCVQGFLEHGVDGVLCTVHHWFSDDRAGLLVQHPCTVFYEDPGLPGAAYVTVNRAEAVRLAVAHLAERGRRRIALAVMSQARFTHRERLRGYHEELTIRRLPYRKELVYSAHERHGWVFARHNPATLAWDFNDAAMNDAIDRLVRDQHADAIVAHDDYWAATLIKLLRKRGIRVPSDVAIVGYLNHYLADFTDPALTSIDLSHEQAARDMVGLLERVITSETLTDAERIVSVTPRLIVRDST